MKITISHIPEEAEEAAAAKAALLRLYPRAKVRKSSAHPPNNQFYLTIKRPEMRCGSKKKY